MASGCYICLLCGYVYDPAQGDPKGGIAPGTPGEALPPDWHCPNCGADQNKFARKGDD